MAIAQIQNQGNPQNSLIQILQGGQDTISGILNQAIQLGRDRVNNQMRQDDNMMQQRQAETALAQRRGENLTNLIQDSRKMTLAQGNADRNFGLAEQQEERALAKDVFNMGMQTAEFAREGEQFNAQMGLRQQELGLRAQDANRDATLDALRIRDAEQNLTLGDLSIREAEAELKRLESEQGIIENGGVLPDKPLTPTEQRLRESAEIKKQEAQRAEEENNLRSMVVGDTKAFGLQESFLPEKPTQAQEVEAKAADKKKFEFEVESARNFPNDRKTWVDKMPNLTETQRKKREQLWEYANRKKGNNLSNEIDPPNDPQFGNPISSGKSWFDANKQ